MEEVIMLINYYIEKGSENISKSSRVKAKDERIRVNDKTASGGWY